MTRSQVGVQSLEPVDVLIVTGHQEAYRAVQQVGGQKGGIWRKHLSRETGLQVASGVFRAEVGGLLRVVVVHTESSEAVAGLVSEYKPYCLAECGVCAGRPEQVGLGDILIPSHLGTAGQGAGEEQPEGYRLWGQAAEALQREARLGAQLLDEWSEPGSPRVHVGALATRSPEGREPQEWGKVPSDLLGVERVAGMAREVEAAARREQDLYYMVVKGVGGNLGEETTDSTESAATAAVAWLATFLRAYLPPAQARGKPSRPLSASAEVLLWSGTARRPREPSPAALLNARYRYVPFYKAGRAELLAELESWRYAQEAVSIRLFHGAGGMGKTRLFIEWSKQLRRQGWRAGFLAGRAVDVSLFEELVVSAAERPVLVVIDYAESQQQLVRLLRVVARWRDGGSAGRLRVALLAREVGDWWEVLQESSTALGALLGERAPTAVSALAPHGAEREEVFREAAKTFARIRGKNVPPAAPEYLREPLFERVLFIHMAALAVVEGLELSGQGLMDGMLDHEERFWSEWWEALRRVHAGDGERRLSQEKCRLAVCALTLVGGAAEKQDARALQLRACGEVDELMMLLLRDLYPAAEEGGGPGYVGWLEPDLLGEAMVLRTLRREGAGAGGWLRHVFEGLGQPAVRTGFEVLGRLSSEYPDEAEHWIAQLLENHVPDRALAAFEAARAVGERTVNSILGVQLAHALQREGTAEVAAQIDASGLPTRTTSLLEVALWVTTTLLQQIPAGDGTDLDVRKASLLVALGRWQNALGKRWEALESTSQAVTILWRLAEDGLDTLIRDLAMSLNNLGAMQSELGRREDALKSAQDAVEIYRRLTRQNGREEFLPDLAMSLNNLGNKQSELGKFREALEPTREAVEIYRRLASKKPDVFLSDLAMSLNNLGNRQSELGMVAEALQSIQDAVEIRRRLAKKMPDAFLVSLAMSLGNLGVLQSKLGMKQEALETIQESVSHYRRLVKHRPDAFLQNLAVGLNNLSNRQNELGKREEALKAAREAVECYRRLAAAQPGTFLHYLAISLNNLGNRQSALGQEGEALESARQAVEHYRQLAKERPGAFLAYLAISLHNLSNKQSELGQKEEALQSSREALDIIWPLFQGTPEAHEDWTGHIFEGLKARLTDLGLPLTELLERLAIYHAKKRR